jgi:pimeloyl-ACP methyl ester carboxylesterase
MRMPPRTTVVLVHGAFADASGWAGVDAELAGDFDVLAPPNPLRGVAYGGAVISLAGLHDRVVSLVYVAAYALDEGESLGGLQGRFPDSRLAANLRFASVPVPGGGEDQDVSVDPAAFGDVFAADLPAAQTAFMGRSQRPLAASAFGETVTAAAWKQKPSWGVVPTADTTINPEIHRYSYERAGMRVTELEGGSHAVFISQPAAVAAVIREAAKVGVAA